MAAIDRRVNDSPWSEQQYQSACSAATAGGGGALVLVSGGRIEGFMVYGQVLDEASIHNIAVDDKYQGKGLGCRLLKAGLLQMKQSGVTRCLLEVRESNTPARHLYQGQGFQMDGVRKNYYPKGDGREDALLMSLQLRGMTDERA